MIESVLSQLLTSESSITALVDDRIYPIGSAKPSELYIVYQLLDRQRPADIDNAPAQQSATFQLDIYGERLSSVVDVTDAITNAFHYQSNNENSIQLMRIDAERTNYDTTEKLFNKSLDLILFFNE